MPNHPADEGFSLLEALIAIAIFAVVFSMLQTYSQQAIQKALDASFEYRATDLANSLMREYTARIPSTPSLPKSGAVEGMSWEIRIGSDAAGKDQTRLTIQVTLQSNSKKSKKFSTLMP